MKKILFFLIFLSFETKSHEFNPAHLVVEELDNKNFIYLWFDVPCCRNFKFN